MPPTWRWHFFTPWVARWPEKLCRFMAPADPRPLLVPTTSTAATSAKTSTFNSWPTSQPSTGPRNSRMNRLGSQSAFETASTPAAARRF